MIREIRGSIIFKSLSFIPSLIAVDGLLLLSYIDVVAAVIVGGHFGGFDFAFFGDFGGETAALDGEEVMAFYCADFHFAGFSRIHPEDGIP